jgi:hypothetical protein
MILFNDKYHIQYDFINYHILTGFPPRRSGFWLFRICFPPARSGPEHKM